MLCGRSMCRRRPQWGSRAVAARVWQGGDLVVSPWCRCAQQMAVRWRALVLLPHARGPLTWRHDESPSLRGRSVAGSWHVLAIGAGRQLVCVVCEPAQERADVCVHAGAHRRDSDLGPGVQLGVGPVRAGRILVDSMGHGEIFARWIATVQTSRYVGGVPPGRRLPPPPARTKAAPPRASTHRDRA